MFCIQNYCCYKRNYTGEACMNKMSDYIKHSILLFLKKDMATHSGILTWKIPWIEEPGGL